MTKHIVRIACQQLHPILGEGTGNHHLIVAALTEAMLERPDLIVFPELATSGYAFRTVEEAQEAAISLDGDPFGHWKDLLKDTDAILVAGFPELAADGAIYNSAAVMSRDGLLAVYRKTHLWNEEKLWFRPGPDVAPIIETQFGRLGVMICYDLEFPEVVRDLMLRGAEVIAVPTNWPSCPHPPHERPAEMSNAMVSRA